MSNDPIGSSKRNPKAKAMPAPDLGFGRWIIIDQQTGEILDDAQGYGYKSAQAAHRAYAYKTMPKAKKQRIVSTRKKVEEFWKNNEKLSDELDDMMFCAIKDGEEMSDSDIEEFFHENDVDTRGLSTKDLMRYR